MNRFDEKPRKMRAAIADSTYAWNEWINGGVEDDDVGRVYLFEKFSNGKNQSLCDMISIWFAAPRAHTSAKFEAHYYCYYVLSNKRLVCGHYCLLDQWLNGEKKTNRPYIWFFQSLNAWRCLEKVKILRLRCQSWRRRRCAHNYIVYCWSRPILSSVLLCIMWRRGEKKSFFFLQNFSAAFCWHLSIIAIPNIIPSRQ